MVLIFGILYLANIPENINAPFSVDWNVDSSIAYGKQYIAVLKKNQDGSPHDLSQFADNGTLSFWMYVPEAVNTHFRLAFSMTAGKTLTGYIKRISLNKAGWNHIVVPLDITKLTNKSAPADWDWSKIQTIILSPYDWDGTNNIPKSFKACISDVTLHSNYLDADLPDSIVASHLDGALFSLNGYSSIIDNRLIRTSFKDDSSIVYQEDGSSPRSIIFKKENVYENGDAKLWLPLAAFGARYDENAVYNDNSHILKMKLYL